MKLFEFLQEKIDIEKNKMILVGGRPAMGKTTFVVNVAKELISQGRKVLFFDLEGGARKLFESNAIGNVTIVDNVQEEFDVNTILNKCREMENITDYVVVIDYLQIISRNDGSVHEVQTDLKCMVDELGFTLILTAQLSREIEKREDKRPKVSDLNMNTIDAKLFNDIWFLYRPAYYEESANKNVIEVINDDTTCEFYWDGKEHIVK